MCLKSPLLNSSTCEDNSNVKLVIVACLKIFVSPIFYELIQPIRRYESNFVVARKQIIKRAVCENRYRVTYFTDGC